MAQDSFDVSPDKLELKGSVRGVTRISKKAKIVAGVVVGLIVLLVMASSYEGFQANQAPMNNPDGSLPAESESKKGTPKKMTTANLEGHMEGVGDGQSAMSGAAKPMDPSAVPVSGDVTPAPPQTPLPGTAMPLPTEGKPPAAPNNGASGGRKPAMPALGGGAAPSDGGIREPGSTTAREREQKAEQDIDRARRSGLDVAEGFDSGGNKKNGGALPASFGADIAANGMPRGAADAAVAAARNGMGQQDDPNKQQRKEQFLKEAEMQPDRSYLKEVKRVPMSKYTVTVGWKIPAGLECGANSDVPGQLCAIVRENVYDSATGRYLLIPQGTKVVGAYDSQVAIGQKRLLVVWNQLIFEDGSILDLKGMPGADQAGFAGFDADVDNHYLRAFAMTGMMSIFSAGFQLSQPQTGQGSTAAPSASQTMAASVGQQLGQLGAQVTQRQLQIQPTLSRNPGYRFNIMITRSIVFPGEHRVTLGQKG